LETSGDCDLSEAFGKIEYYNIFASFWVAYWWFVFVKFAQRVKVLSEQ